MLPAAPGSFLVLIGGVLMAIATCSTPIIKSLDFLHVDLSALQVSGHSLHGDASFGCLGYCIASNCSSPTLGYTFDLTHVLGDLGESSEAQHLSQKLSSTVLRGLTYTMVLHPVAAGLCAAAAVFGLLSMCDTCLSPCFSGVLTGIASTVSLLAFAFDLALFLILKNRLKKADAGLHPSLGTAVWITLAGWIVILLGSCGLGAGLCRARRHYADRHRQRADDLNGPDVMPYGQGMPLNRFKGSSHSQRSQRSRGLWGNHDDASSDEEGLVAAKHRSDDAIVSRDEDGLLYTAEQHNPYGSMPAYTTGPHAGDAQAHDPTVSHTAAAGTGGYADPYTHAQAQAAYASAYPAAGGAATYADPAGYGYGYADPAAQGVSHGYADTAAMGYPDATPGFPPQGPTYDYAAYPEVVSPVSGPQAGQYVAHMPTSSAAQGQAPPTADNMYGLHR